MTWHPSSMLDRIVHTYQSCTVNKHVPLRRIKNSSNTVVISLLLIKRNAQLSVRCKYLFVRLFFRSISPELCIWDSCYHRDTKAFPSGCCCSITQKKNTSDIEHSIRRHHVTELHQPWYTGELLLLLNAQLPSERTLMPSEWCCPLPIVFFLVSWMWLW